VIAAPAASPLRCVKPSKQKEVRNKSQNPTFPQSAISLDPRSCCCARCFTPPLRETIHAKGRPQQISKSNIPAIGNFPAPAASPLRCVKPSKQKEDRNKSQNPTFPQSAIL